MNRRFTGCMAALSIAALAACSNEVVAPPSSNATLRAAAGTAVGDGSGNYLVLLRSSSPASGIAAKVASLGGTVTYLHEGAGIAAVSGLSDAAAAQLAGTSGVQEVKANAVFTLSAPMDNATASLDDVSVQSVANPTTALGYSFQWNMRQIGANVAWAAGKLGSSGVTVAIIDSGLDYNAPDLNGLVDLSRSASFVATDDAINTAYFPSRNKIDDYNGHGTNVATQVSSKAFVFAGVTSRTTMLAVKVIGQSGSGPLGSILLGILWSADHGANVANMSLGGAFEKAHAQGLGAFLDRVVNYANRKGMLIVAAAGNAHANLDKDGNTYNTWCSAPHVICVSAVGPTTATGNPDEFAYYSNYGRSAISVAAPGGNASATTLSLWPWGVTNASYVWSYCPKYLIASFTSAGVPNLTACFAGNRLSGYNGTSQASPHVAGLAALLMAENPGMSINQVKSRILSSADDLGQPGADPFYGRGRINVAKAVGL